MTESARSSGETRTALSEEEGVWVVLDAEGLPEAVYCREDTAREYADDPNENKAGEGPFTVARFVRAASVARLDGKPNVRDADGLISGEPMVASPELTMLREMADLVREYFDERNRPAVSWDGMPSVQDQKHRRERIVELLEAVHVRPPTAIIDRLSGGSEEPTTGELKPCPFCGGKPEPRCIGGVWLVSCIVPGCYASVNPYGLARSIAVEAWNRRVSSRPDSREGQHG